MKWTARDRREEEEPSSFSSGAFIHSRRSVHFIPAPSRVSDKSQTWLQQTGISGLGIKTHPSGNEFRRAPGEGDQCNVWRSWAWPCTLSSPHEYLCRLVNLKSLKYDIKLHRRQLDRAPNRLLSVLFASSSGVFIHTFRGKKWHQRHYYAITVGGGLNGNFVNSRYPSFHWILNTTAYLSRQRNTMWKTWRSLFIGPERKHDNHRNWKRKSADNSVWSLDV